MLISRFALVFGLCIVSLFELCSQDVIAYGAGSNPTGSPIGGGLGYQNYPGPETEFRKVYKVRSGMELLVALANAIEQEMVYVLPGSVIDLTGEQNITISKGVTLMGDRGRENALGPMIFTDLIPDRQYLFHVEGNARITGLRIKGPEVDFTAINYPLSPFVKGADRQSDSKCMAIFGTDVEIDNCEISNFHRVGIDVQRGTTRLHIHHNYLHNIHAYPVLVVSRTSMPIIVEANIIEWIWQAIAGTGAPGTGYEARYNRFILKSIPLSWYSEGSHAIDMHPDNDIEESRGDLVAGDYIHVHHNTFLDQSTPHPKIDELEDVKIRGIPRTIARFHHNKFHNSDPEMAVAYKGNPGNLWVHDNLYGPDEVLIPIAKPSTPQILFQSILLPDREIETLTSDTIPVNVNINVLPSLTLSDVTIQLNEEIIFSGSSAPGFNRLLLSKNLFDKSLPYQRLTVKATDSQGGTGRNTTVFAYEPGDGGTNIDPVHVIFTGSVAVNKNVILKSCQSIVLEDGFTVHLGGTFSLNALSGENEILSTQSRLQR